MRAQPTQRRSSRACQRAPGTQQLPRTHNPGRLGGASQHVHHSASCAPVSRAVLLTRSAAVAAVFAAALAPRQVIAEHLYREGRFQLGDAFVHEAALPGGSGLKAPYVALHTVLQQVRRVAAAAAGARRVATCSSAAPPISLPPPPPHLSLTLCVLCV